MKLRNLWPILFSLILLLSGCASMSLPDTEVCAIKGSLPNGMFCSTTISRKERDLTFEESIDFLHAREELDGTKKGAALCQSSKDWVELKTALESACVLLGKRCKKKIKKQIKSISRTINKLKDL